MSTSPFRLKGPLGRNYRVDLDDTRRTKEALQRLGYFETPSYGLTDYPDESLFSAIENFQRDHDLRRDGVMKPGGETATRLGQLLADGADGREANGPDGDQVAQAGPFPLILAPLIAGAGVAAGAAGDYLRRQTSEQWDGDAAAAPGAANENRRTDMPSPPPAVPPSEPDGEKPESKEELPATPPAVPTELTQPVSADADPDVHILPMPDEDLAKFGSIVENRKGNELTQAEIDRIRDWFLDNHKGWKHIAGGRDRATGKQLKEYHISAVDKVFGGRGLKGGNFVDLTFESPSGKLVHIQTVDVDKNGKPAQRELDASERIFRAERDRGIRADVVLIPKNAQLNSILKQMRR